MSDIKLPRMPNVQVPRIDADVSLIDIRVLANWCQRFASEYARAAVEADRADRAQQDAPTDAEKDAILHWIIEAAQEAKQPCSQDDPESPAAIRNGKLASIAQAAAQALGMVRGPLFAPAQDAERERDAGIEAAARWIDTRRDDFDREHGYEDPDTGALEYGTGPHAEAKREYSFELAEIAEGLRALKSEAARAQRAEGDK